MIRGLVMLWVGITAAVAQVRQGGVYQIETESLDSGGGASRAGSCALQQSLPGLGGTASGGVYSLLSGFAGQLGSGGTGSGPAAFLAWQTVFFGGPAEPGAGPYDDPDHDGVGNLLEFAFNLPPFTASTALALPDATGGLPWIREEEMDGTRYFMMDCIRRKNAGDFQPQTATDLTAWSPAAFTVLSGPVSVNGAYERLKLRLDAPIQPGQKVFYRLAAIIQ